MAGVEGTPTWSYSIGILETLGHPALVVTDMDLKPAQALINAVFGV